MNPHATTTTIDTSASTLAWSPYQIALYEEAARGTGHIVARSRAGCGKTSTILEAQRHVPLGASILMCAFSKPIAEELKRRAPRGVRVETLHAFGLATFRRRYPNVEIVSDKLDRVVFKLMPKARPWLRGTVRKLVSLCKSCLAKTHEEIDAVIDIYALDVAEKDREKCVAFARQAMIASVEDVSTIDFDDMIFAIIALGLVPARFSHVFIDEYQDFTAAQGELSMRAVQQGGRVMVAMDDRQQIYQFRGANRDVMNTLIARLNAKVLPLPISYRCSRAVVEYAQTFVPDLEAAPNAPEGMVRHAIEVDQLLDEVQEGDFVLSRNNAPLTVLCAKLLRRGRRATIAGKDIGKRVSNFVHSHNDGSLSTLLSKTESWREREIKRLKENARPYGHVEDLAAIVRTLADGCRDVDGVTARADQLFSDEEGPRIELSSVHKAKGLERQRVWMLEDSFDFTAGAPIEEENIAYVSATRAKTELNLVVGIGGRKDKD